jgi:hypothetical protein
VLQIEPEAAKRGIKIDCDQASQLFSVHDHVHLQVLLNLALNGLDPMKDVPSSRQMVFRLRKSTKQGSKSRC